LKIVDDDGHEVPQGEIGDLLVRGETAALFYWHQYKKSQQTFRGEWLFTGDKYYVDQDGYYWHAGRSDDLLKVGGIWVSPVEVESTLISHPAVLECAVVGHPDPSRLIKPKAFVVLKEGYTASPELANELIKYCQEKIAAYKRPRWIEFVDELPKTATGKIQRFKLRGQRGMQILAGIYGGFTEGFDPS
jgi:4-hydroxybenzoate-CoA ligase/benzoate-CoA ligase